jgi:NAD(P)-dependent dehydrogenase (short-subunit alcohol dehydrogenase family)
MLLSMADQRRNEIVMQATGGRLAGRHAIVTGGGRGIGRAVTLAFLDEGCDVLVVGRTSRHLEAVVAEGRDRPGTATAHVCDVSDDTQIVAAVERADLLFDGHIDVLVNNAGVDDDTPFVDVDRDRWRTVVATNLTAPFVFSQEVARRMRTSGGGVILHTASIDASGGDGPFAAYNASKAGLLGLNRTMALELAQYGIRSNCVSPGVTDTDMTTQAAGPGLRSYLTTSFDRVPLRRLVEPREVAAAFVFLASDEASAITGTEIRVDAGLTANWYVLETLPPSESDSP